MILAVFFHCLVKAVIHALFNPWNFFYHCSKNALAHRKLCILHYWKLQQGQGIWSKQKRKWAVTVEWTTKVTLAEQTRQSANNRNLKLRGNLRKKKWTHPYRPQHEGPCWTHCGRPLLDPNKSSTSSPLRLLPPDETGPEDEEGEKERLMGELMVGAGLQSRPAMSRTALYQNHLTSCKDNMYSMHKYTY